MTVEGMQEMETNWFVFRNLRLDVPVKGQTRTIVDDVSGECKSGECLAILGPSGAGKTSLLNILTLNVASSGSDTYGKCTLNGHRLDQKLFQKHCVFVEQLDNHRAFLTPRQSLRYSLDFYNPESTDAEKDEEVSQLLKKLGLEVCADTKIGNLFIQGLSGGQKKRLSVALALVKKPEVLFLDEPTSGLDAAASSNVIKYIRELARDLNIVVIATVHQPSSSIYMSFQNVMILSSGRTAYFGSPDGSVSYFAKIGHPMPEFSNPAEHILDVVNAEFTSSDQVRTVLNSWAENASSLRRKYGSVDSLLPANVSEEKGAIITDSDTELPWLKELMFVFRRQAHIAMIDPMIYIGRAFGFLFACTFFSIIYVESRERTQEQVLNRLWLSMWFAGVPTSMGVVAVYAYSEEFAMIKKEVKNGMYSLSSYLIASAVLQVPGMLILALAAVGIPGFAVGNMWAPHFAEIIALYMCLYFSYECIARMYSVLFDNPLMGMLGYMNVWFTSFLFAGIMIPEDQVIWPFRALVYALPLNWSVRTVTYLDSIDAEYDGAYYCDGDVRSDCIYHFDDDGEKILPGWTCSEVADGAYNPMQCFGNEGWQTLDSLGKNYESISSEDETDRNFGIIIAIAATMWTVYVILAYLQVSHVTVIKDTTPPPVAEKKQVSPASSSSSSEQVKKTAVAAVASTTSFEVVTVSESDYEPVAAVP